MTRLISRRIPFAESVEPGAWHDADCAWNEDTGCEACEEEMDSVSNGLFTVLEQAGQEVLDVMLTNTPRHFAGHRNTYGDAFWEFELLVRPARARRGEKPS